MFWRIAVIFIIKRNTEYCSYRFPFRPLVSRLILTMLSSGYGDSGLLTFFFLHMHSTTDFPHEEHIWPDSVE